MPAESCWLASLRSVGPVEPASRGSLRVAAPAAAPPTATVPLTVSEFSGWVRFLLWFNFDWLDVVLRHLILWVGFLGAAVAVRRRKHITVDALSRLIPERAKPRIDLVVTIVATVVCLILAWAAWRFVAMEASTGRALFGWVPGWAGPAILPVGFALLAFHYVVRAAEHVTRLRGREVPPDPDVTGDWP